MPTVPRSPLGDKRHRTVLKISCRIGPFSRLKSAHPGDHPPRGQLVTMTLHSENRSTFDHSPTVDAADRDGRDSEPALADVGEAFRQRLMSADPTLRGDQLLQHVIPFPDHVCRRDEWMASAMRRAAAINDLECLRKYTSEVLGLWSGWTEAVSTALMGPWEHAFARSDFAVHSPPDEMPRLWRDIRTVHRQLQPLWERRAGGLARKGRRIEGKRTVMLEMPCGENLTLRDVLPDNTCPEDSLLDRIPGDPRLVRILTILEPDEREVVLALGRPGITTWRQAAEFVGADEPRAFGERVRLRARRLAAEQRRRDAQRRPAPASGLWQPEQEDGASA